VAVKRERWELCHLEAQHVFLFGFNTTTITTPSFPKSAGRKIREQIRTERSGGVAREQGNGGLIRLGPWRSRREESSIQTGNPVVRYLVTE